MGKLYNAAYNTLSRFDSFMRNLGKPKVDAITSAAPSAAQAIKQNPSIAAAADATSKGIPTITSGSPLGFPIPSTPSTLKSYPYRRHSGSGGSSARQALEYYEAPLATYYGFGKETAYQEALANTAYRREIDDMRKAGLNPSVIYGDHNTTGAGTNIYPEGSMSGGSGGSGGYGRRYRGSKSGKYLFSGGAYYGIMTAAGVAAAAVTKNVGAGMAAAGLAGTAMKAMNGFLKK